MASFCPTVEDLCVVRGDSPVIPVVVSDENGDTVDITGYTFVMTVDPSPTPDSSANNNFSLTVGPVADGTDGTVFFQPSTGQMDLVPSVYFYDIQMTTTLPSVRTLMKGKFTVQQDVSKT